MSAVLAVLLMFVFQSQPAAFVAGVVIDSETKAPIRRARVLLARIDAHLSQSLVVIADESGAFGTSQVPPGTYRVFADREGYRRGEHDAPLTVAAGQRIANLTIALTPTAVISGRVMTENGAPVSKVYVRAFRGSDVAAESRTNDLGEYRLFGLEPAGYIVGAERYPGPRIEGTTYRIPTPPCPDCRGEGTAMPGLQGLLKAGGFIDPQALTGRTYPAVYFPGVTDRATAQPIEVGPGAQVYGINLLIGRSGSLIQSLLAIPATNSLPAC